MLRSNLKQTGTSRRPEAGKSGKGSLQSLFSAIAAGEGGEGSALNQEVPSSAQPEGYTGPQQYYTSKGQVVESPALDTRSWMQRVAGNPDTAGQLNAQAASGRISGLQGLTNLRNETFFKQSQAPTDLAIKEKEDALANRMTVDKARQLDQLALDTGQTAIPINGQIQSGAIPFDQPIESPQAQVADWKKQGLSFYPTTTPGVLQNQRIAGEQATQEHTVKQNERLAEQNRLTEKQIEIANQRKLRDFGGSLFLEGGSEPPSYFGKAIPGHEAKTTMGMDAKGNPVIKSFGGYNEPVFNAAPRPVGNIYNKGTSNNIQPTALQDNPSNRMSTSSQDFVVNSSNGSPPTTTTHTGGEAPKVSPPEISVLNRPVANQSQDYGEISPLELQDALQAEYIKRLQLKMQNRAWNPTDYSNVFR